MYAKYFLGMVLFLLGFIANASTPDVSTDPVVINGPLYILSNNGTKVLNYPNLEFVNGPIYISYNSDLKAVLFPKLLYVNGPIYITYNAGPITVSYPQIRFMNGPVYTYGNGD